MAAAGVVAVLLPGAFYFLRETKRPPVDLLRRHSVPIALATDCNPGTSPLTSLLLTMNMGATLFGLTVDECIAGVTREAARALGRLADVGTLEAGKSCDLAIWDIDRPAELVYRMGYQPAPCPRLERTMTPVLLRPGQVGLAEWRAIYRGAALTVDPGCRAAISRGAEAVDRIVARGEPVYGINTGFGKLASVRIAIERPRDLAAQYRAVARIRRGRANAGADRAADDGAQAREPGAGRLGRPARDGRHARGHARAQT